MLVTGRMDDGRRFLLVGRKAQYVKDALQARDWREAVNMVYISLPNVGSARVTELAVEL